MLAQRAGAASLRPGREARSSSCSTSSPRGRDLTHLSRARSRASSWSCCAALASRHGMSTVVAEALPQEPLRPVKGFMFDVDGTLLLSDRSLGGYEVLPGAVEVLTTLQARSIPFVVLTNGSAYPPAEQAAKLRKLGLPVADAQMLTPFQRRGRSHVAKRHEARRWCSARAASGTRSRSRGSRRCSRASRARARWRRSMSAGTRNADMKDIEAACNAIWGGAKLYVASDVPFFATRHGRAMGYSYAIVGAIRRMTKARSILTGKPSLHALRFVARKARRQSSRSRRGGRRSHASRSSWHGGAARRRSASRPGRPQPRSGRASPSCARRIAC